MIHAVSWYVCCLKPLLDIPLLDLFEHRTGAIMDATWDGQYKLTACGN